MLPTLLTKTVSAVGRLAVDNLSRWNRAGAAILVTATAIGLPAQTPLILVSFSGANGSGPNSLVQGADGNFYGTTAGGGAKNRGTVFKLTPGGTLTTPYSFCAQPNCPDGNSPYAGLILAKDGNFYRTTIIGEAPPS